MHFTGILIIGVVASIVIGVLLMVFVLFLAYKTTNFIVGEAVTPLKRQKILKAVASNAEVKKILSLKQCISAQKIPCGNSFPVLSRSFLRIGRILYSKRAYFAPFFLIFPH